MSAIILSVLAIVIAVMAFVFAILSYVILTKAVHEYNCHLDGVRRCERNEVDAPGEDPLPVDVAEELAAAGRLTINQCRAIYDLPPLPGMFGYTLLPKGTQLDPQKFSRPRGRWMF